MRNRWKQILAAGMSAIMLAQPVITYASELTENIEVQNESGLENDEQVNTQQENLESDEQVNIQQENLESDEVWYEDELIEETEVTIGSEDEIYDEQYTEEEESDPQDVIENVEPETEDGSEVIVEEETESETSDLIETYANVNNLAYIDGIYAGTLEQVNWSQSESEKFELVIDGVRYNITNNVDLMIDRYAGEQVIYTLANGKIDNIEPVSELLQPSVSINATPDSFFYQNGSYNTDKITATVNIYCIYQTYSQYFGASKYTKEELGKIEGLYVPVKQVDLKIGDHLNFGTKGMILKKEITEVSEKQIPLSLKNPISYKYDIYVDKKYVPTETNVKSVLSATLVKTDDSIVKCKDAEISIGSQEQQQKQLVAKDSNTDKNKAFTEMQNKLMNCTAIALDAKLDEYFSKEQIDEMKRFIAVYVAEVINADHMEDPGFFQQVSDNLRKKVRDNILKKLHVSYNSLLFYETKEIVINMEAETKNNGQAKIKLDIPIGSISSGDESPFGAWGPINYSVSAGASTLISGEGMITYANMEAFSKTMLNYLEIAYKEAWGNDANKIASMFVGEPINTLMDGDYSGKIYKLARKAATGEKTNVKSEAAKQTSNFIYRYVKKAIIHCPVNVYVYDEHDNLCASVVDDTIVNNNNEIFLVVNGDEKYVYLTKDNYKIRLEGTDQGTMEYAIQEYQDGECIRSVCTKNIPLEKGTEYTAIVPAVPRIDSSLYRLKNKNNNEIVETSDTYDDSIGDEITSPVKSIKACGECGDSAYWVLYEDGTMIIYGTGDISYRGWYSYKDKIKKVEIREGITSIGDSAFSWCDCLEYITIPDSVTEIGTDAFWYCKSLITVSGGSKLKKIYSDAFGNCTQLKSIIIPASVEKIGGRGIFIGCENLKTAGPIGGNYDIEYEFTEEIPSCLFAYSEIEEVSFPDTIKKIGKGAFSNCSKLESITIPDAVTEIGNDAFCNCTQLKSITIPSSLEKVGDNTQSALGIFDGCENLKTAGPASGDYNIKYEFTEEIPSRLFARSEIEEISFPDTIKEIGYESFSCCSKLESITIPDAVTEINAGAFEYCTSLTVVSGGSNLKRIGTEAFRKCIQLKSITIPGSIKSCGRNVFEKCTNLKSIGSINENCNIKLGSIEEIPAYVFEKSEIEKVNLPDTVKIINYGAFENCEKLTTVSLGNKLEKIDDEVFYRCTELKDITIPASVFGSDAEYEQGNYNTFGGCTNLKTVGPSNGNYNIKLESTEKISGRIFQGSEIEEISIPETVKSIGEYVFYNCGNLKKVKLSSALTYIGNWAFDDCNGLESLTIPNKVREISDTAFVRCRNLTINVYVGSYAAAYVKKNRIPYILLEMNGEKHEHVWDAGEVTKSATCIENGRKIYECIYCRETKQEDIPATGKHSFGSYVVVKQPTVLANGTKTRTCSVCGKKESLSVSKLKGKIRLTKTALTLKSKGTTQLSGIVTDMAKGDYIKSYVSDNTKIATVNSKGLVTAKAAGKANIKITLASGVTATVKITVQLAKIATTKLQVASSVKLTVGQKKKLTVTVTPKNSTDKVTYTSANKKIATISSNGTITAKKAGKTKITVKSGSKKATVTVTVAKKAPTGIKGIPAKKTLKKGKTLTLKAKLVPTGTEAKVTYKSSNKKVATVDSKGKVKAKKAGTAVITVTAGKVKTTCKITVK